jgi:ComF family protein
MIEFLLDLLFPKKCLGCGKTGSYVCQECQVGVWEAEPGPRPANLDGLICLWAYDGLVKKAIKQAKYNGRYDLLKFLISNFKFLNNFQFHNVQAVVSVPLHRNRFMERGFNQAEVIAKEISKIYKIPVVNLLTRIKDTGHQTLRTRPERLMALKNAFKIKNLKLKVPQAVLLVDDVLTTGATLSECAKTLKKAGVKKVYGLVLAR